MADAMLTKSRKMGFVLLQRLMSAILELRSNWTHVEMFPATASQYSMTALNELLIFLNARTDALTSDIPSFPFTTDECDMFINVLQCRKVTGNVSDSYVTTYVAKLWERIGKQNPITAFPLILEKIAVACPPSIQSWKHKLESEAPP
ncbi:hypothetical protein DFH94DRAFT_695491 [Russula ochroleuca]|nr:hypothetical protein DFH94DRAFT_695491 [Russula ochroleuca]